MSRSSAGSGRRIRVVRRSMWRPGSPVTPGSPTTDDVSSSQVGLTRRHTRLEAAATSDTGRWRARGWVHLVVGSIIWTGVLSSTITSPSDIWPNGRRRLREDVNSMTKYVSGEDGVHH